MDFDTAHEVQKLKEQTRSIRKRSYSNRISKLDKYKTEVLSLRHGGASYSEIHRWLKKKRYKVAISTVQRFCYKCGV